MKPLQRYPLLFLPTINYVRQSLKGANSLSDHLLKLVDFEKGRFYTLLFKDSQIDSLHDFKTGIISRAIYLEVAKYVYDKLPPSASCIIDDVIRNPSDPFVQSVDLNTRFYENEIYYLIDKTHTVDEIVNCLRDTNAIWHALCLITDYKNIPSIVTEEIFKEICSEIRMILVAAYDGEGYIFWERARD
jgi:hypothetical protein